MHHDSGDGSGSLSSLYPGAASVPDSRVTDHSMLIDFHTHAVTP